MVIIQAAINVNNYEDAINAAEISFIKGANIIEISNKITKKFGYTIARDLKLRLPRTKIYFDLRVIEDPEFDFELAYECGADIISVLAVAPYETITTSLNLSKKYGIDVALDFLGINDPINKVLEILQAGIYYYRINVPRTINNQSYEFKRYVKMVKELSRVSSVPIAVRINNDITLLPYFINIGASIIILDINNNSEEEIEQLIKSVNKSIETAYL
jgi:3-hexulose-6-phosphate synthase and related proteins